MAHITVFKYQSDEEFLRNLARPVRLECDMAAPSDIGGGTAMWGRVIDGEGHEWPCTSISYCVDDHRDAEGRPDPADQDWVTEVVVYRLPGSRRAYDVYGRFAEIPKVQLYAPELDQVVLERLDVLAKFERR